MNCKVFNDNDPKNLSLKVNSWLSEHADYEILDVHGSVGTIYADPLRPIGSFLYTIYYSKEGGSASKFDLLIAPDPIQLEHQIQEWLRGEKKVLFKTQLFGTMYDMTNRHTPFTLVGASFFFQE